LINKPIFGLIMNTLFVGQNRIDLDHIDSTNKYLANHKELTELAEGTIVTAKFQTEGKGQRDRVWYSEPLKNVMVSILLRPKFLEADDYFILNKGVTLAVLNTVEHFTDQEVQIKWPNDTLVNQKKVAGLLIELNWRANHVQNAIIGMGLNVNQTNFSQLPNATSLSELAKNQLDLEEVLKVFCKNLEFQYLQIRKKEWDGLLLTYNQKLWRRGEETIFIIEGEKVKGTVVGVGNNGQLNVEIQGQRKAFSNGEISLELT